MTARYTLFSSMFGTPTKNAIFQAIIKSGTFWKIFLNNTAVYLGLNFLLLPVWTLCMFTAEAGKKDEKEETVIHKL